MLVAEWTANAQTFVNAVLRALPFRARDDGQSGKISTSILRQGNPVAQTVTNVLVTVGGTTVATLAAFP